ncbi:MAG: hypothetical protein PHE50_01815 [Dehalococcoidales bacterium]|nr:hypothetical protein [Dehalococcoidales bacterium]
MLKMLTGFGIGVVFVGALFMGPLRPLITQGEGGTEVTTPTETVAPQDDSGMYTSGNIKQILQKAGAQINDPETGAYYYKLVNAYNLQDAAITEDQVLDEQGILKTLPDIAGISKTAAMLPLIEAGKKIKDPEIAKFYYDFIQTPGWNIQPEPAP